MQVVLELCPVAKWEDAMNILGSSSVGISRGIVTVSLDY